MLILRPVPVIGEAVAPPFYGQIYIDEWSWNLSPASAQRATGQPAAAGAAEGEPAARDRTGDPEPEQRPQLRSQDLPQFDAASLIDDVRRLQTNRNYNQQQRDRRVRDLIERAAAAHQTEVASAVTRAQSASTSSGSSGESGDNTDADSPGKLTFSFTKNTDLASTQMLYSMANNHLIPTIILTVFQRSSRVPVTLIITMGNVRFTSFKIACDGKNETMSDMLENWVAEYETIDYAYQNRPPIGLKTSVFNAATQGRVKVFVMKPRP